MSQITIKITTKKLDEEALRAILRRVILEAEKAGMKGVIKEANVTIEE